MRPAITSHPRNQSLSAILRDWPRRDLPELARPEEVDRPYDSLGTHPDLAAHLWDEITSGLPEDCRFVFRGAPALLRPDSGIVFGFAGGTSTCALRLPEPERSAALAAGGKRTLEYPGTTFDLDLVGPEWVFCLWLAGEAAWCRAAYDFAGTA
jgi:hypothetical protein